ncbi:Hypothetical predicted protein [Pelobates cultripes]|uniref:Uncharacterized protein n=1 Tax=Pelobates cultripes TaxID=61616 RepID=A0AAD1RNA6_PELCU|nr:Hypothetical predicted protein [Pelobates cultripes]
MAVVAAKTAGAAKPETTRAQLTRTIREVRTARQQRGSPRQLHPTCKHVGTSNPAVTFSRYLLPDLVPPNAANPATISDTPELQLSPGEAWAAARDYTRRAYPPPLSPRSMLDSNPHIMLNAFLPY